MRRRRSGRLPSRPGRCPLLKPTPAGCSRRWRTAASRAGTLILAALVVAAAVIVPLALPHDASPARPVMPAAAPAAVVFEAVPHPDPARMVPRRRQHHRGPSPVPSAGPRPNLSPAPVPVPSGAVQAYARSRLGRFGWDAGQFGCLVLLWDRESGWRNTAREPTTGAYGVPQANSHGQDGAPYPATYEAANPPWYGGMSDADVQVEWGLVYIADVYESPCAAWDHELTYGFY